MTSPLFATKHRLAFSILTIWVLFCAVVVLGLDARLIKRRASLHMPRSHLRSTMEPLRLTWHVLKSRIAVAGRAVAPVYGFTLAAVCITLLTLLPL
jgi:hypothetical protein